MIHKTESKPYYQTILLVLLSILAGACHNDTELNLQSAQKTEKQKLTAENSNQLYGKKWVLLDEQLTSAIYVVFQRDHKINAFLGCNRYFGKAVVKAQYIELGPVAATRKMCSASIMKKEARIARLLSGKVDYYFREKRLILKDTDRNAFSFVAE